jgi:hypothetical protein
LSNAIVEVTLGFRIGQRPTTDRTWHEIVRLAVADLATGYDSLTLQTALSVVAIGRGDLRLGALLCHVNTSDSSDYVEEHLSVPQDSGNPFRNSGHERSSDES